MMNVKSISKELDVPFARSIKTFKAHGICSQHPKGNGPKMQRNNV